MNDDRDYAKISSDKLIVKELENGCKSSLKQKQ